MTKGELLKLWEGIPDEQEMLTLPIAPKGDEMTVLDYVNVSKSPIEASFFTDDVFTENGVALRRAVKGPHGRCRFYQFLMVGDSDLPALFRVLLKKWGRDKLQELIGTDLAGE